jgi:magnesium-transporting ATPase (P-type)
MFDKDITEILQELKTQEEGLNDEEIKERIAKYGLNQLPTKKNDS